MGYKLSKICGFLSQICHGSNCLISSKTYFAPTHLSRLQYLMNFGSFVDNMHVIRLGRTRDNAARLIIVTTKGQDTK